LASFGLGERYGDFFNSYDFPVLIVVIGKQVVTSIFDGRLAEILTTWPKQWETCALSILSVGDELQWLLVVSSVTFLDNLRKCSCWPLRH
jgi:hypothetical protein